jgi:hypothetical protein
VNPFNGFVPPGITQNKKQKERKRKMKLYSKEIHWCESDDRYVVIVKVNDDEIIGLNYQQGRDVSLEELNELPIDEELTDFFLSIWGYLTGDDELDTINQAIWAHLNYLDRQHERSVK